MPENMVPAFLRQKTKREGFRGHPRTFGKKRTETAITDNPTNPVSKEKGTEGIPADEACSSHIRLTLYALSPLPSACGGWHRATRPLLFSAIIISRALHARGLAIPLWSETPRKLVRHGPRPSSWRHCGIITSIYPQSVIQDSIRVRIAQSFIVLRG